MKFWKWTIILSVIVSVGILVGASFLSARLVSRFSIPLGFDNGQVQPDHPFLGRYGTFVSSFGMLFTLFISGILVLYIIPVRVRRVADSFSVRLSHLFAPHLTRFPDRDPGSRGRHWFSADDRHFPADDLARGCSLYHRSGRFCIPGICGRARDVTASSVAE